MNVLVLTHRLPYPPDKGERIRAFHWLSALSGRHRVDLLSLSDGRPCDRHVRSLSRWASTVRVVPRRKWANALRLGAAMMRGDSLTEAWFGSRRFTRAMAEMVQATSYDVVLAICSSAAAYTLAVPSRSRLAVDLIDVDSEKWRLYAAAHTGPRRSVFSRESRTVGCLECRLLERADVVTTVSNHECRLLAQAPCCADVMCVPNGVDTDYFGAVNRPAERRDTIVFLGQMDYFPNVDAAAWFARNVWPSLAGRHPDVRFVIVGRSPTAAVRRLARQDGVVVTGTVDDVRPFLQNAIVVAPLRVACGVQNKVLQAMAAGCPVVASGPARRGLDVAGGHDLLIADTVEELNGAVDLLLRDRDLAETLADHARAAMSQRYRWALAEERMRLCVEALGHDRYTDVDFDAPHLLTTARSA